MLMARFIKLLINFMSIGFFSFILFSEMQKQFEQLVRHLFLLQIKCVLT